MSYTDEDIARAAGLDWPCLINTPKVKKGHLVDFLNDPGAVAEYLLPVLEKRVPAISSCRNPHLDSAHRWLFEDCDTSEDAIREWWAPTWHECVIEAIMATKPAEE